MTPRISIIAAITPERVIGKKGGGLLWHLPEDLKRFKKLTTGHAVIMGRKTYETLGKPLPNRTNIIITRQEHYHPPGCVTANSLQEALNKARVAEKDPPSLKLPPSPKWLRRPSRKGKEEIFIMGGGEIYGQAIGLADKLYLTLVHPAPKGRGSPKSFGRQNFEGDVFFPDYSEFKKEVFRKERESTSGLKFTFLELER